VWITGIGMVLVAAFTLRALKRSFFEENVVVNTGGTTSVSAQSLPPITFAEKLGACLLMFTTLAVGLYPKLVLDRIVPAVEAMRFLR
jgi:NADH-quinone oxidoreductase subunit M